MKAFLIWIAVSIGSLFGIHSQPATLPVTDAPMQTVQTQTDQSATGSTDQSSIVGAVKGMLLASHSVKSYSDAQNVMTQYYSVEAIQKLQAGLSKVSPSQLPNMQKFFVTIDKNYPDPSSLQFSVMVNGAMATATASLPDSSSTSTGSTGYTVAMFHNSINVILQKESGTWKVNTIDMISKGFDSHEYTSSPSTAIPIAEFIAPGDKETLSVGQPYNIKWKIEPENIDVSHLTIDINVSPVINHQSSGHTATTIVSKLTAAQVGCPTSGEVCTYTWTPTTTSPSSQFEILIWPNVKDVAPAGVPSSVFSIQ